MEAPIVLAALPFLIALGAAFLHATCDDTPATPKGQGEGV